MEHLGQHCLHFLQRKYVHMVKRELDSDFPVVIQPNYPSYGFFAHYISILGVLKQEIEEDNAPYIDMGSFPNCYLRQEDISKVNTWDWYFEQPFPISSQQEVPLKKILSEPRKLYLGQEKYCCKIENEIHVIRLIREYGTRENFQRPEDTMDFLTEPNSVAWWRNFAHTYTRWNSAMLEHIEDVYQALFPKGKKILGVLLRGTDFSDNRPWNHTIAPTVSQAVPKIREVMQNHSFNQIFLATEDERIVQQMQAEFPNQVIIAPQKRFSFTNGEDLNHIYAKDLSRNPYLMGRDYLTAMALLGKCDGMMACRTSGAIGALLLADDFDYVYFWNLGRYRTQEYPAVKEG